MIILRFTIGRCYQQIIENAEDDNKPMFVQCDFLWMLQCKMYKSRHFLCVKQQKDPEFR